MWPQQQQQQHRQQQSLHRPLPKPASETIHSGHFMVSHFEADAQDDEDNDLSMPDPDAQTIDHHQLSSSNSPSSAVAANAAAGASGTPTDCTDELILPHRAGLGGPVISRTSDGALVLSSGSGSGAPGQPSGGVTASGQPSAASAIIDISLTKLFKCMNLAYSQKLTSPKWNRFKGVRLRWKDKIRLNNLIWRCWHMQFTLKTNTLVCQFASPLDVDLHSKPEAVLMEGKYWKRHLDVIKAEYQKWRKFHRTRGVGGTGTGNAHLDTVSEFDALDAAWSPSTSEPNMLGTMDDYYWTSDTLFSTIGSTPFPFPDSREMAKAGIADFIQPSLGPLQPNLDDFMNNIPFQQLLNAQFNTTRLAPVPEEAGDDMFMKSAVDYADYPALADAANADDDAMDVVVGSAGDQQVLDVSAASGNPMMMVMQQQQQQQQVVMQNNAVMQQQQMIAMDTGSMFGPTQMQLQQQQKQATMNNVLAYNQQSTGLVMDASPAIEHPKKRHLLKGNGNSSAVAVQQQQHQQQLNAASGKPFGRRTVHNYDKALPTPHQTIVYNQVVAQQQQQQQIQQQQLHNMHLQQQQQPQQQMYHSYGTNITLAQQTPIIQTTTNHYMNVPQNALNLSQSHPLQHANQLNAYCQPIVQQQQQTNQNLMTLLQQPNQQQHQQQQLPQQQHLHHQQSINKTSANNPNLLSLLAQKAPNPAEHSQPFQAPLQHQQSLGSLDNLHHEANTSAYASKSSIGYRPYSKPNKSPNYLQQQQQQQQLIIDQQQQQQQQLTNAKEMYRSKSLPLNATLQLPLGFMMQQQQQQQQQLVNAGNGLLPQPAVASTPNKDGPFTVPSKYQVAKPMRHRSNSLIGSASVTAVTAAASTSAAGALAAASPAVPMPAASPATGEPVLSTLAKLLTSSGQSHQSSSVAAAAVAAAAAAGQPHSVKQLVLQKSASVHNLTSMLPSPPPPAAASPSSGSATEHSRQSSAASSLLGNSPPFGQSFSSASSVASSSSSVAGGGGAPAATSPSHGGSDQRRAGHIHAEQKRRYNIKNGFDALHTLIPQLQQNPNAKLSKAAMLQKCAEYIRQLRAERSTVTDKMDVLRRERDALNNSISHLHSVLPANGAPMVRQKNGRVRELYDEYVRTRSRDAWKFWILGLIVRPLFDTFNTTVSVASMDELTRTAILWVDQHCSLMEMRPAVSNQLRYLSTTTDVLSDPPSSLEDEVLKAIS